MSTIIRNGEFHYKQLFSAILKRFNSKAVALLPYTDCAGIYIYFFKKALKRNILNFIVTSFRLA